MVMSLSAKIFEMTEEILSILPADLIYVQVFFICFAFFEEYKQNISVINSVSWRVSFARGSFEFMKFFNKLLLAVVYFWKARVIQGFVSNFNSYSSTCFHEA